MDKIISSRGRAHSIASIVLRRIATGGGLLDEASVTTSLTPEELAMVKQEMQAIANEHARLSLLHKAIEQGTADRRLITHNYMNDPLTLSIEKDEEEGATASVTWGGLLGYSMVKLYCTTPVEADRLFEALQKVCGIEED